MGGVRTALDFYKKGQNLHIFFCLNSKFTNPSMLLHLIILYAVCIWDKCTLHSAIPCIHFANSHIKAPLISVVPIYKLSESPIMGHTVYINAQRAGSPLYTVCIIVETQIAQTWALPHQDTVLISGAMTQQFELHVQLQMYATKECFHRSSWNS